MTKFNEAQLRYLKSLIVFKSDDPAEGFDVDGSIMGDIKGSVLGSVMGIVRGESNDQ